MAVNADGEGELSACQGWLITSQTCDIVRDVAERLDVEVAALVKTEPDTWKEATKGLRPRYATVRSLEDALLVADLDRIMTVSKRCLVRQSRTPGCQNDAERRALRHALARKRARAAFPDDFVALIRPLQRYLTQKNVKATPEGDALRALREIRVHATPEWPEPEVEVVLYLLWETQAELLQGEAHATRWETKLPPDRGRFTIDVVATTLERLSARTYVDSDPLDLDHLTVSQPSRAA